MVKTGKEVSKSSFIIFTALIRIGVTVKKTFPHSPHLLCWHIKSFENYWKTALTLPPTTPPRHFQACTPCYPIHGRSSGLSNWWVRCSLSSTGLCPFLVKMVMTPFVFSCGLLLLPCGPFPSHSCAPCGRPTWISHLARPGSSLSLLFSLDLWW